MKNKTINIGDKIRKHSIIGDENSSFKEATVEHLLPMYSDGEILVWAGSGGAHHPKACVVLKD